MPDALAPLAEPAAALAGVRVLDFTWVIAGPMATRMLGAMGAEIIKVETGTRPEFASRPPWFGLINGNKLSCTINIKHEEGRALVRRLVAGSDVLIENFSAGVLDRAGLGYEALSDINPGLIYVAGSGLGRSGPLAACVAYGSLLQGYSGRAAVLGTPNAEMEGLGLTTAWTDPVTAVWENLAILAALEQRDRHGHGCFIDMSMLESTVALLPEMVLARDAEELDAFRGLEEGAPHGLFRAAGGDDWVALSVRDDAEWLGFCRTLARDDLQDDPALATRAGRTAARATLDGVARAWTAGRAAAEAAEALARNGVPACVSASVDGVMRTDASLAAPLFPETAAGQRGIALPWTDQAGSRGRISAAPALGVDNEYVFGTLLGLDAQEIARLGRIGAIA